MDAGLAAHQGVQLYNIQGGCSGTSTQKEKKKQSTIQPNIRIALQKEIKKKQKKTHRSHRPQVVWRSGEYKVQNKNRVFCIPGAETALVLTPDR